MILSEELAKLKKRAERTGDMLTEEATKTAIIMPMIRALGYDVFDPEIVIPEFVADVGIKKGEKIDYAIRAGDRIELLIEAKPINADLAKEHASQLYRYFSVTSARFGCLTNGAEWWFFTDLVDKNKMDSKPFFRFSLRDYSDHDIVELEKFSAEKFSVDNILSAASDLKYKSLIIEQVKAEMNNPTDEFVRMIGRRIYEGNLTSEIRGRFTSLLQAAFRDVVRDQVNQRLKDALGRDAEKVQAPTSNTTNENELISDDVKTTEDEMEAFRIIRAIAAKDIDPKRIYIRDAASYCAVLLDNNNRKPVARLYLEGRKKRIGVFSNKIETKKDIDALEDIYSCSIEILAAISEYNGAAVLA